VNPEPLPKLGLHRRRFVGIVNYGVGNRSCAADSEQTSHDRYEECLLQHPCSFLAMFMTALEHGEMKASRSRM
jgi:hypothetical protein